MKKKKTTTFCEGGILFSKLETTRSLTLDFIYINNGFEKIEKPD